MAASLNRCTFIGNLGHDPELKYTSGGAAVCEFSLAVNESWKDREGKKQEATEWVRVKCWAGLAEVCSKYLAKGRSAYVEGRMKTRKWQDKDGNDRWTTEIIASKVEFLSGGSQQSSQGGGGGPAYEPEPPDGLPFIGLDDPTPTPDRRAV